MSLLTSASYSAEEIVHDSRDRELGMHRKITRRDFLNGVAVTAGAAMMPWDLSAAGFGQAAVGPESSPNYYPPALTGHARQPSWLIRRRSQPCAMAHSGTRRASPKIPAKPTI